MFVFEEEEWGDQGRGWLLGCVCLKLSCFWDMPMFISLDNNLSAFTLFLFPGFLGIQAQPKPFAECR